jgi:anti-sigma regulatory factor (Ser/Thr protein kinase)
VLILTGVSAALAWRQYRDNEHRAVSDLDARVSLVGAVVDSYLAGGVSTLEAMSQAPSVVQTRPALMASYFKRVASGGGTIFTGGIGWADRTGDLIVSSSGGKAVNVADRVYFQRVTATGKPFISAGLVGRKLREPIVVIAVPTRDASGRITGVITGGIQLKSLGQTRQTASLAFEGLTIADRDGQLLLSGLARTSNPAVLGRIRQLGRGDLTDSQGLDGGDHHVIAFATATLPSWTIAIDRPASDVYASARRGLMLEAVSLAAALLAVLLILGALVKRSRREIEARGEQAQSWSEFTRALALASTPADVADAVLESLQAVYPDAVVVVTLDSESGRETRATSKLPGWRRVAADSVWLRSIEELAVEGPVTRSLERDRSLRPLYLAFGRRLKALHSYPVSGRSEAPVGGIGLLTERSRLAKSEWELLGAFAAQAGQSLERARAFEHEHELAVRLQQSLLPADLPSGHGLSLAGVYLAGGDGIAVGGDWYDAVLRPDGILQLCVGDVSGRGVGAATVMGRMRGTFRAYAYDLISPAEILRRMLRHVNEDEMITAACVSIDPIEGVLSYSCAGHPPPILLDSDAARVVRLQNAGAPPLGVAEPSDMIEELLPLPDHALLAMYTDGLVERRGESIDDGIDVLSRTMLETTTPLTARRAMSAITEAIGAPSDDVALLLGSIEPALSFSIELPALPESLRVIRRRLRAWLEHVGFDGDAAAEIVLAVSEACSNTVEHAYNGNGPGGVSLSASLVGDVLHLEISDRGRWVVKEANDERGRGINLMNGLMDRVEIDTGAQGTRILLERRRLAADLNGATTLAT